MYNVSDPIFGSYDYDSEVSREEEQKTFDEVRIAPGRVFMDDLKTVIEAKWTLQELETATTWARMKVKK